MKVFDFDNTIYNGESFFDFGIFIIQKKKSFLFYLPIGIKMLFFYKFCKYDIDTYTKDLERYMKPFLKHKELFLSLVPEFWEKNAHKLYPHMLEKIKKDDVIVTASPSFLIKGIEDVLNTKNVLATEVNLQKWTLEYLNFQTNKVKIFQKKYSHKTIDEFYTDSYNDEPFMKISKNVFLVKKGVCKKIK